MPGMRLRDGRGAGLFGQLSASEKSELYLRYRSGEDLTAAAAALGLKVSSLERELRRWAASCVPPSPKPTYDKPETITEPALVLSDAHCPYHDADFVNQAVEIARGRGAKVCILAGDLLDMNFCSPFVPNARDLLVEELELAEAFLGALRRAFERVVWLMGNHEFRLFRLVGSGQLPASRLQRMVINDDAVVFSPYFYCRAVGWMVCHPANASVIGGRVASRLATKYHCNVVAAHGHIFGIAQDESGQYIGIDSGACADPHRLEYIATRPNTRPQLVQGAVVIEPNRATLLTKTMSFALEAARR
jgi:hypothetical protein